MKNHSRKRYASRFPCLIILLFLSVFLNSFDYAEKASESISLKLIGTYSSGAPIGKNGAEIVAYWKDDSGTARMYLTNACFDAVDIVSLKEPRKPLLQKRILLKEFLPAQLLGGPTSLAIDPLKRGFAVAVNHREHWKPGNILFFDMEGQYLQSVQSGCLPDMVTFDRKGEYLLVANEGEPSPDLQFNPLGTISIITIGPDFDMLRNDLVSLVEAPRFGSVRCFLPEKTENCDVEPEYIAIATDNTTAYVSLQENNAIAVVNLAQKKCEGLYGLGLKNNALSGNEFDASDKDSGINIKTWPVMSMYMPDGIATLSISGKDFLVTANEGESVEFNTYTDEVRVKNLRLDEKILKEYPLIQSEEELGRLHVSKLDGNNDSDEEIEQITAFGARSFSIWDPQANFQQIYDSGSDFERYCAHFYPTSFNCNGDQPSFDARSDDMGVEPEGIVIGKIGLKTFAFIGLERFGGVMVYDVTDPFHVSFAGYATSRRAGKILNLKKPPRDSSQFGGISPEGLFFVSDIDSPVAQPLLLVANEISGTVDIFAVIVNYK